MARWLPSFGFGGDRKAGGGVELELKDAPMQRASQGRGYRYRDQAYVPPGTDVDRMVRDGYERVIWAFKAIDAIADKMSSWPIKVMEGFEPKWRSVDDDCLPLLNHYANEVERSAKYFRYRLISQLLLSKRGVFVEVVPTNGGKFAALNLLPPAYTSPVPDPDKFLAGFRVDIPGVDRGPDLPVYAPEKRRGVLWIRKPHPTDPYSSITPLEAAGISLDLDFYARLYNRNFLLNDGRAGQLVAVKGGLSPEDAAELKSRFSPGMGGAGRTTVVEADAISVQDTAVSPRDAQYAELRNITKEDLLIALGTPESVIGNASGRTFDNADAEKENWLDVTVLPLSAVVESGFDGLTKGGWGDDRQVVHDTANEPVLQRVKQRKIDKAAQDVTTGLITRDEYRAIAELSPLNRPAARVLWAPITGMTPIGKPTDEDDALKQAAAVTAAGAPAAPPAFGDPAAAGAGGLEGFDPSALGGGTDPAGGGLMSDPAMTQALGELAPDQAPPALEAAALPLELETKRFNPNQPRYPTGHPRGGQFMDTGDVALWLAGKPLKGGYSSAGVVDPNAGSTAAARANQLSSAGGATRFTASSDPAVAAAAKVLTFPHGYAYPRVLNAPPAIPLAAPKQVKVVSLRKGDVVVASGKNWSVAGAKRNKSGSIDLELVDDAGNSQTLTNMPQQGVLPSVARTPHPTVVADARRTITSHANQTAAAGGGGAPRAVTPTPTPAAAPSPSPAAAPAAARVPAAAVAAPPTPSAAARATTPSLTPAQARTQQAAALGGVPGTTLAGRITPGQTWVAADGTVVTGVPGGLHVSGGSSGASLSAPQATGLSYLQRGAGASNRWAAVPGTVSAPTVPAPAASAPTTPSAAGAGPQFNLPPAPPGSIIYAHPQGKHIYVLPNGSIEVWKPDGTRGSTSATAAKLAAGHGAWTRVAAPATGPVPTGGARKTARVAAPAAAAPPSPAAAAAPTHTTPPAPSAPPVPAQPAAAQAPTPPPAPAAAPSATPSRAAKVLANGVPAVNVSSQWSVTGSQKGSNAAAEMTAPGGRRFYVKSLDAVHADNEVGAARLYAAAGVEVPTVHRATLATGLFAAQKGHDGIASEIVAGTPDMSTRMGRDPKYRDAVLEDFAVHAWLGNWDAVENNNTMTGTNGRPLTVDVGGAMLFRAQGGRRPNNNQRGGFGSQVQELQTMRSTTGTQRAAFGQLTPDSTDGRFVAGVERVAAISPQQVRDLVDSSYPSLSAKDRKDLGDTLIARRADLASKAGVTLPENRAGAAATPAAPTFAAPPAPPAPAATAPAAPAAAPVNPNVLGTAAPASILTYPPGYPYPIVQGAPPATPLRAPKSIKVASLRKGDVVSIGGTNVSVVSVDRRTGDITYFTAGGQTRTAVGTGHPTGVVTSVARTPHPQLVAAARRAQRAGGAPVAPAPVTPPTGRAPRGTGRFRAPRAAAPAAAATPTPAAAATPTPAGPVFTSAAGTPALPFATRPQAGQTFTHPRTGNTMVIGSNLQGTLTLGPRARGGTAGQKTMAMTARTLKANGWQATSGPDIDVPGPMHAAAVRKAARLASLPPVGQPHVAAAQPGVVFPSAATGVVSPTARSNLTRGMTVRVGGEDWIVTETTGSSGVWGYRPGVDNPNTIVRQADGSWLQGQQIPGIRLGHSTVDVIGPAPQPATNVPTNGAARAFDATLGAVATDSIGSAHGAPFTFNSQLVPADQLKPGDVILLNGREGEGSFVVDHLGTDAKGRQNIVGYGGTTADATGVAGVPTHLMLTGPSGHMRQVRVQVNGAVPGVPDVPRPVAPRAASTIAREDISDPTSQTKAANIMAGRVPPPSHWPAAFAKTGDRKLAQLMDMRGYHEFPDVVSDAELDQYVDDGEIELFRGMTGSTRGNDLAEEFRSGTHYSGGNGGSLFGTGQYAGYGAGPGVFQGANGALDFASNYYAGGNHSNSGVVTRMTIKADARVGEFDMLYKEMRREANTNPAVREMERLGNAGVGHYAVYKGYDMIRGSNGYMNRHGSKTTGDDWKGGFIIILNRSAIRISENNFVAPSRIASAPGGKNPPPKSWATLSMRMNNRKAKHANGVDYRMNAEP